MLELDFESLDRSLRPILDVGYDSLSPDAKHERDDALKRLDKLCSEVVEISFSALADGKKAPEYDSRPPFRGLYAFEYKDREFFFGRESEIADLQDKVRQAIASMAEDVYKELKPQEQALAEAPRMAG